MTVRNPKDDDIVEAQVVEEEQEPAGPGVPERPGPFVGRHAPRRKKSGAGLGLVVLMLIAVGIAAVIYRKELTRLYDRWVAPRLGLEAPAPVKRAGGMQAVRPPEPERPRAKPDPELPNPEVPVFERRTEPEAPKAETTPEAPPPVKEPQPGLAYSIVKREDVSYEGIKQIEVKVVVPPNYRQEDLLRMGQNVVAGERRLGERHAVRILCFTDPGKTASEDTFAEVVWAPGGDFFRAADAVNKGIDRNEFKVNIRRTVAP